VLKISILWPPPYYLLRDRIPFFLTLLYIYIHLNDKQVVKHEISENLRDFIGNSLLYFTYACLFVSINFMIFGTDMEPIVGFRWSFPSPIEWSIFVILCTRLLTRKGLPIFESYYLSLLMGLGGGWLYEILYGIPYWIQSEFAPWNWLKFNAVKIFFIEFQVLAIPLVLYILYNKYNYTAPNNLNKLIPGVLVWHFSNFWVSPFLHRLGSWRGNTFYSWVLRIPVMILLYKILEGVKIED